MFPACAGMNRYQVWTYRNLFHVPRVCGDEPALREALITDEICSPRVRG